MYRFNFSQSVNIGSHFPHFILAHVTKFGMNIISLDATFSFLLTAVCNYMTDARTCEVGVALAQLFGPRNANLQKSTGH